ncbi:MAG: cupredoxin domain-containing protein [Actinomycetota bacterium]
MGSRRYAVLVAGFAALALVTAACGGGDDETTDTPTDQESGDLAPGSAVINIVDLAFEPSTITVASGTTEIAVTNADSTDHTFTLDDGSVDEALSPGQEVTVEVDLTASTGFHCEIHPSMTGTLEVA